MDYDLLIIVKTSRGKGNMGKGGRGYCRWHAFVKKKGKGGKGTFESQRGSPLGKRVKGKVLHRKQMAAGGP